MLGRASLKIVKAAPTVNISVCSMQCRTKTTFSDKEQAEEANFIHQMEAKMIEKAKLKKQQEDMKTQASSVPKKEASTPKKESSTPNNSEKKSS